MRKHLGIRFLLTAILMLLAAMGTGTVMSWWVTEDAMNEMARSRLKSTVEESVNTLQRWLDSQRFQIAWLRRQRVYRVALEQGFRARAARRGVEERFSKIGLTFPYFASLSLLDSRGRIVASDLPDDQRMDLSVNEKLYRRALQNQMNWSSFFRSGIDGSRLIGLYAPVVDRGGVQGVLYFEYNLEDLVRYSLKRLSTGKSGVGFLLDGQGRIIAHPDPYMLGTFFRGSTDRDEAGNSLNSGGFFIHESKGKRKLGFSRPIEEIACRMVAMIDVEEIQAPSRRLGFINLNITIAAILVTILVLYLLWRSEISIPVDGILEGIERFRRGERTGVIQIEVDNEFKTVADSFNSMAEDIEKSTVSLEALRQERQNLQTILDSMGMGIVILEADGKIRMMNLALRSLLGIEGGMEGKTLDDLELPPTAGYFTDLECVDREVEVMTAAGEKLTLVRRISQLELSTAFVQLISFVDISDQKKAAEQQRRLEMDLQRASRLKAIGTLSAGITREIEGPVSKLSENLRFLDMATEDFAKFSVKARELSEETAKIPELPERVENLVQELDQIDLLFLEEEIPRTLYHSISQVEKILRIITAMQTFGEGDDGVKELYDLNDAIESAVAISRNQWHQVVRLDTRLAMDLPMISCFGGEINQVILALIVNGVDAIRAKNETDGQDNSISITTWAEQEWIGLSVRDTGVGMDRETLERIFDPFFTTKPVGEGTGQGLFLARRIVEDHHGGRIEVESTPGEGTTFTVRLPRA